MVELPVIKDFWKSVLKEIGIKLPEDPKFCLLGLLDIYASYSHRVMMQDMLTVARMIIATSWKNNRKLSIKS